MQQIFWDLFKNFLLGGLIVASISYIATYVDPLIGAIWWSFPVTLVPSLWFMHSHGKNNTYLAKFALSTTYALVLLVIATFFLSYFYKQDSSGFIAPIIKSSIIWFIASIIFYKTVKYYKLDDKFM